eukprot:553036-Hanusia_phi.AAC.1
MGDFSEKQLHDTLMDLKNHFKKQEILRKRIKDWYDLSAGPNDVQRIQGILTNIEPKSDLLNKKVEFVQRLSEDKPSSFASKNLEEAIRCFEEKEAEAMRFLKIEDANSLRFPNEKIFEIFKKLAEKVDRSNSIFSHLGWFSSNQTSCEQELRDAGFNQLATEYKSKKSSDSYMRDFEETFREKCSILYHLRLARDLRKVFPTVERISAILKQFHDTEREMMLISTKIVQMNVSMFHKKRGKHGNQNLADFFKHMRAISDDVDTARSAAKSSSKKEMIHLDCLERFPVALIQSQAAPMILPAAIGIYDIVMVDDAGLETLEILSVLLRGKRLLLADDKVLDYSCRRRKTLIKTCKSVPQKIEECLENGDSVFDLFRSHGKLLTLHRNFRFTTGITKFLQEVFNIETSTYNLSPSHMISSPSFQVIKVKGEEVVAESREIISKMKDICQRTREVHKKSKPAIGIISLKGRDHATAIEANLMKDAEWPDMSKRVEVVCGDAYDFKGHECDIVILSMVDQKAPKWRRKDDLKLPLYLACTRARVSVYFIHSFVSSQLEKDDLRSKMLASAQKHSPLETGGSDDSFQDLWCEQVCKSLLQISPGAEKIKCSRWNSIGMTTKMYGVVLSNESMQVLVLKEKYKSNCDPNTKAMTACLLTLGNATQAGGTKVKYIWSDAYAGREWQTELEDQIRKAIAEGKNQICKTKEET